MTAQDLIDAGYLQISRKFRHLARPPTSDEPDALRLYNRIGGSFFRMHADRFGCTATVCPEIFAEFRKLGGRAA